MSSNHFADEFARLYGKKGCSIENYDWSKPRFFDPSSECYAAETALMSSLTSEAYNKFGFAVEYYIKQVSTKRDKLYGEDRLENIVRRFVLNVYTDNVPQQERQYTLQGMDYKDIVQLNCTIQHFREASTRSFVTGNVEYDEYYPKIGDLMYFSWNKTFYEIVHVKTFAEGSAFLSTPITFQFIVKVWKPTHEDVDVMQKNEDNMDNVRYYAELAETFNIASTDVSADKVDIEKNLPFSSSGDVLAINNSMNGYDESNKIKSVSDRIYKDSDFFDPFDN